MLEFAKSRSRTGDNELLFLRKYKCRNCGNISEFLQTPDVSSKFAARCDHCSSSDLESFVYNVESDYYW